jgi:hypothetical protein
MTLPTSPTPVKVEINPTGSAWVDITTDVRGIDGPIGGINLSRGRTANSDTTTPASCNIVLDNSSGNYTFGNPMGTYYPNFTTNTELRVYTKRNETYLDLKKTSGNYSQTADHASLDIVGDIDIRMEASAWSWGQISRLAGKWDSDTNNRSWAIDINLGQITYYWSTNGTNENYVRSTAILPRPGNHRQSIKITHDVNNGASGNTVAFYYSDSLNGTYTQLGSSVVTAGTTSIYSSNAVLRVGGWLATNPFTLFGMIHKFSLRSSIGGTVVANPDFTTQADGATTFADSAGRTWTLGGAAEITKNAYRFSGEISDCIPSANIGGHDPIVTLTASGVLRRYSKAAAPLNSTLREAIPNVSGLVQYWPCEDVSGSTQIASAISGYPAMHFGETVKPDFESYSDFHASKPIPIVNGAAWSGKVPYYADTNSVQLRFLVYFPASDMTDLDNVISIYFDKSGTIGKIILEWLTAGGMRIKSYDQDMTLLDTGGTIAFAATDVALRFSMRFIQNGTAVDWYLDAIRPGAGAGGSSSSFAGRTIGRATKVVVNPSKQCNQMAIGHVSVQNVTDDIALLEDELDAWRNETSWTRIARLCLNAGAGRYHAAIADGTTLCGYQDVKSFMEALREIEATDDGLLTECRWNNSFYYLSGRELNGNLSALTISCSTNQLSKQLEPSFDDSEKVNQVTVSRVNGSSAYVEDATSVATIGEYNRSYSVNPAGDLDLPGQALWRLTQGSFTGARHPVIEVDLSRTELSLSETQQILDLDIGDRLTITNQGVWAGYDDINLLIVGIFETINNFQHIISFNCVPSETRNTGVRDYTARRAPTSTLDEVLDTTETGIDVASTGQLWTVAAGDYPISVMIGGEEMTFTAMSGSSSPQTATAIRSVNGVVKTHAIGTSVSLKAPNYRGL